MVGSDSGGSRSRGDGDEIDASHVAVPCCCLAPADAVGLIVGRGGATVRQISRDSGAEISITGEEDTPPTLSDRIVTIRGEASQKELACREIARIIHQSQEVEPDGPGIFVLVVPASSAGYVVGPKGSTITSIMESSGAEVEVSRNTIPGTELTPVSVTGSLEEALVAAGRIDALLQQLAVSGRLDGESWWRPARSSSARPSSRTQERGRPASMNTRSRSLTTARGTSRSSRSTTPSRHQNSESVASARFFVSAPIAAWVVGREGRSISELRARSGASIEVPRDGGASRVIELSGSSDSLAVAIESLIECMDGFPAGAPGAVRMIVTLDQPEPFMSEVVQQLQEEFGVEIAIEELDPGFQAHDGDRLLVISGARPAVPRAAKKAAALFAAEFLPSQHSSLGSSTSHRGPTAGRPPAVGIMPAKDQQPLSEAALLKALLVGPGPSEAQLKLLLPQSFLQTELLQGGLLRSIASRSGSRLELLGTPSAVQKGSSDPLEILTITGTMMGNAMAIYYIQDLLSHVKGR